jgi:hypothetical protein
VKKKEDNMKKEGEFRGKRRKEFVDKKGES